MNRLSESYIDPEQLYQLPSDSTVQSPSTLGYSPGAYLRPQLLPMDSLDDPLKYYRPVNPDGSRISPNNSLADSGYGAGPAMSDYFVLPSDLDRQETSLPTAAGSNTEIQELSQFDRSESRRADDIVFEPREEKPPIPAHNSRRSPRASDKSTPPSEEPGTEKRQRNRVAASKCRKKQKLAHSELQEKAGIVSEQHSFLVAHKAALESEMVGLKNELLLHGTCGDEPISAYLMQTARDFVKGRERRGGGVKVEDEQRAPPAGRGRHAG
ncbi:hypothetical protein Hte_009793 [Hypoxylon texense]